MVLSGEAEDKAMIAANNLKAVASIRNDAKWPEGSAMEDAGMEGRTWARIVPTRPLILRYRTGQAT